MKLQNSLARLQTRASDSGLAFWGEGSGERGDDDDIVMQTPRTTSPEEPLFRFFQYFRDVGPSHIVTNCTLDFANSTLGFARAFGRKLEIGWGKLVFCAVFKVLWSCRSPLLTTVLQQHCCFPGGGGWRGA